LKCLQIEKKEKEEEEEEEKKLFVVKANAGCLH